MDPEPTARILSGQVVRLKDGVLRVVATVGEFGAWESLGAERALEVVDGRPDVPVHITPGRQLVPGLQQPLANIPRCVGLVLV